MGASDLHSAGSGPVERLVAQLAEEFRIRHDEVMVELRNLRLQTEQDIREVRAEVRELREDVLGLARTAGDDFGTVLDRVGELEGILTATDKRAGRQLAGVEAANS